MTLIDTLRKAEAALVRSVELLSTVYAYSGTAVERENMDALMMLRSKIEWLELAERE